MAVSKVLQRKMFRDPSQDENVGIMQGFMDDVHEMLGVDDMFDEEPGEEDDGGVAKAMGRRPNSPEILMNNLRGDMRSVDARIEELAEMVGYNAAASTPPEVLALLQPVLKQQGIAALEAAAPAMPDMGMAPPGMPEMGMAPPPGAMGMAPPAMEGGIGSLPQGNMGQPPMQMARGGPVQYFQTGSGPEAVTSYETRINELLGRTAQDPIDAMARARELTPQYQELLGTSDKGSAKSQMLFDIAQAALGYAANVGPDGQPLRGSQASRLAGAARALPGQIAARGAQAKEGEARARLAALGQAQSEREAAIAANTALSSDQLAIAMAQQAQAANLALELAKQKAPTEAYQTLQARSLMLPEAERPAFIARGGVQDAAGSNLQDFFGSVDGGPAELLFFSPDRNNPGVFKSSNGALVPVTGQVTRADTADSANYQRFTGSVGGKPPENFYLNPNPNNFGIFRQTPEGLIPVTEPVNPVAEDGSDTAREQRIANLATQLIGSGSLTMTAEQAEIQARNIADGNIKIEVLPSGQVRSINLITNEVKELPISAVAPETLAVDGPRTLFQMAEYGTGPGSYILNALSTISGVVGGPIAAKTVDARTALRLSTGELIRAMSLSRAYAVGEQERIIEQIQLLPAVLDNPEQLRQRMITVADSLKRASRQAEQNLSNPNLSPDIREDLQRTDTSVKNYLAVLGAPTIITASSLTDPAAIEKLDATSLRYFINNTQDEELRAIPEAVRMAMTQKLQQEGGGL
jgi:hypothetical protein